MIIWFGYCCFICSYLPQISLPWGLALAIASSANSARGSASFSGFFSPSLRLFSRNRFIKVAKSSSRGMSVPSKSSTFPPASERISISSLPIYTVAPSFRSYSVSGISSSSGTDSTATGSGSDTTRSGAKGVFFRYGEFGKILNLPAKYPLTSSRACLSRS